jgi:hypothetical protein
MKNRRTEIAGDIFRSASSVSIARPGRYAKPVFGQIRAKVIDTPLVVSVLVVLRKPLAQGTARI